MRAGLPRFLLSSRIMSLFVLHRPHGMHVFNRLSGFFSSQVDLLGSRPVKTQSYVIHDDDDDDDDHPIQDYSSSVYRCCVQELCTSSFIPLEVFMILVSIGMAVQWRARAVIPTYLPPWTIYGWISSCDKPRPSTPCSMRATTRWFRR